MRCGRIWKPTVALLLGACVSAAAWGAEPDQKEALRVCADPNNLPQSNERGEGYENRIAEELARDLGRRVEYTWFPQRMGFVRNTLRQRDPATQQFKCDVIIGVPKGYELTATTQPYMRSTYAFLYRPGADIGNLQTADDVLKLPDAVRRSLRIGVFARSPGADWLLRHGLIEQAQIYPAQSGDPAEHPALIVERDLAARKIDAAIVWGPIAGFLRLRHADVDTWRAAPFAQDPNIRFDFEISMGVRFGEQEWKAALDDWIAGHQTRVNEILASFQVPLLDKDGKLLEGYGPNETSRADAASKRTPLQLASP